MRPKSSQTRSWYVTVVAVGGLLIAIMLAGVVGLLLNQRVDNVAQRAFEYDVELADDADDLRAGILELRHYHRNITIAPTSRTQVSKLDEAYDLVLEETRELEELGVPEGEPQPEDIRTMAENYYSDFRPAVDLAESDPDAFDNASDLGLSRLERMRSAAEEIEDVGEDRSEDALRSVNSVTDTARLVLLSAVGGLLLAGAALAYLAVRFVGELRRSYARQQEATEAAEAASRAKTDFIADVSHELRTPLTVLRGNAEVGLALQEACSHGEILDDIVKESEKMSSMVEDLLFLARSDSATLPLEKERIPVEPFLEEVAGRSKMLVQERGARFEAELHAEGEIEADRERAEQAILVFVDNASKFSPEGETVTLCATTEDGELRVSVADRGPGIPKEDLPHVFERFYRVDKSRERKRGGTGLGLSIARTIAESHRGRVEAESRPGEGTVMSIYLPLVHTAEQETTERQLEKERG
jgi:two-component system sensor histidine kinase VicK